MRRRSTYGGGAKGEGKNVWRGFGDSMTGCFRLGFLGREKFWLRVVSEEARGSGSDAGGVIV